MTYRISDRLVSELVRELRGRGSQMSFSRRLGYTTNVVYGWEAGRRSPSSIDFFRIVRRAHSDVGDLFARFFRSDSGWAEAARWDEAAVAVALVRELLRGHRPGSVARSLGCSRTTLLGWHRGTSVPRLPDLLRLVESTTLRSLDFLALFVDPLRLPSVRSRYQDLLAQRQAAYELPWSHAILRLLEVDGNCREAGALATRLGIAPEEADRCLRALVRAKQVRWHGGGWRPCNVLAVDTRANPEQSRLLKTHWIQVSLDRLQRSPGPPTAQFSHNLFAVSEADYQRIRHRQIAFYQEIADIVERSGKSERVVLLNIQLVPLDE